MIVLTGLGAVTALGHTARETWDRTLRGERAFREVSLFPADGYRVRLVAEVGGLPIDSHEDASRTSALALIAATEALEDAGLNEPSARPRRMGLVVGGSTAGMLETESPLGLVLRSDGTLDTTACDLRGMLRHPLSAPADRLQHELGPFVRVRSLSSACSSGAVALIVGATWLELGLVDAVLCGSADALCRVTLSGFNALGALDPSGARPFDQLRRGLTLGEGAGFVVLERRRDAEARGKDPVCALLGFSARAEAHHVTNPEPTGDAPSMAMREALSRAGLGAAEIDYINAHGTGTLLNDAMESRALDRVFGQELSRIPVSSQKGQIGHTLAAAGAIEAVITAMAIASGTVPPTGGLEQPDPKCPLRHVLRAEKRELRAALSSSFGFGGMDAVIVLGRKEQPERSPPVARNVVITGVCALTPAGIFEGTTAAELPLRPCESEAIAFPLPLDLERARRLDRTSRFAAIACERALGGGGAHPGATSIPVPARGAGLVLGNAFGAVDGTSAFMRRLREKGAALVSPADFPGLVPSAPAGHGSIYLGLKGPTLAVADLAVSGECALTQGYELVASGEADRIVVAAAEERSVIVDGVFRVLFGRDADSGDKRSLRREGAGAVALSAEDVARSSNLPIFAHIEDIHVWTEAEKIPAVPCPVADARAIVVFGATTISEEILAQIGWSNVRRIDCAPSCGSHEAAGGIGVAIAAATLASNPAVDIALCLGTSRGVGYAIVLRAPARRL